MTRARNIKPGFYKNEHLAECSPEARLLFPGLWMLADREGRIEWRPKRIRAEIFPFDNFDVPCLVGELAERGFVAMYESGGRKYLQIVNFAKHQKPHHKEVASEIPAPEFMVESSMAQAWLNDEPCLPQASTMQNASCPTDSGFRIPDSGLLIPDSEPRKPKSDETPVVLEFPTDGTPKSWQLRQSLVDELSESFPSLDVASECRQALAWVLADLKRKKTANGMRRFLTTWLGNSQNRGFGRVREGPVTAQTRSFDFDPAAIHGDSQ